MGSLSLQPDHKILPRSRLRCCLLSSPLQAEGMADLPRRRVRCWQSVRRVQLESEASLEGLEAELVIESIDDIYTDETG